MPSVKHSSEYSEKFNIFLSFLAENKFLHIIIWKFFDRMGETMDRVKKMIHTDYAYRSGLSGQNVTVAVMDTGIVAHPDFEDRIIYFHDFCNGRKEMYDDNGHGTHVSGIIAGNGKMSEQYLKDTAHKVRIYSGVAPKCRIIMLKVLDENGNGNTKKVLDELWDAGIMVVAAAGNNGPKENTVTIPGISRKVLTVGSSDDDTYDRGRKVLKTGYSGRGPTACCIVKPEILAPGTGITSCSKDKSGYQVKSGTSMAAPVVSGALALAFEKYPSFTPAEMKLRLYERAYPRSAQLGRIGWGMIHVDHLVR